MDTVISMESQTMNKAWELFVSKGIITNLVRPLVARSWQRCREIDPQAYEKPLSKNKLQARQDLKSELLVIARPIMQEICRIAGKNFIELFDNDGYSLGGYGNSIFPPTIGFNCNEKVIGTNAIGAVLIENTPIEMNGFEHYANWLHSYSCMAAPVHDNNGRIIAVINITTPSGGLPDWISVLINLAVKLIETRLRHKSESYQIKYVSNTFSAIVDLIEEGFLDKNKGIRTIDKNMLAKDLHGFSSFKALRGNNARMFPFPDTSVNTPYILLSAPALVANAHNDSNQLNSSKLECINGVNPIWVDINKAINNAARYSSNTLIDGETGTGKEIIASLIHSKSGRSGKFVAINCGSIPLELIQSELYGYEEGSFTGAKKGGTMGKFELADNGTILLDEIGEMPLSMQVNLLRFLQDKTITRVGSNNSKKLNVQVIAATNRNLNDEISKGNFRADLFYRLNVININIPPLRERRDDIPWLAGLLVKDIGNQFQLGSIGISDEAINLLCEYDWPGNVRELRNILERAIINNENNTIVSNDLPNFIVQQSQSLHPRTNRLGDLSNFERRIITNNLHACHGNVSATAKTLGISRVTLYKKMNKLDISW